MKKILTIFLFFMLVSPVYGANTLGFLNQNFAQEKAVSLNADSNVEGVCTDGAYIFTIEGTNLRQWIFREDTGLPYNVHTSDVGAGIAFWASNDAIYCGTQYVVLGYTTTRGTDISRNLSLIDYMTGKLTHGFSGATVQYCTTTCTATDGTAYRDITSNGYEYILAYRNAGPVNQLGYYNPLNNVISQENVADRNIAALAFGGRWLAILQQSASGQGWYFGPLGNGVTLVNNTVSTPRGMDYGTDFYGDQIPSKTKGQYYIVVYQ